MNSAQPIGLQRFEHLPYACAYMPLDQVNALLSEKIQLTDVMPNNGMMTSTGAFASNVYARNRFSVTMQTLLNSEPPRVRLLRNPMYDVSLLWANIRVSQVAMKVSSETVMTHPTFCRDSQVVDQLSTRNVQDVQFVLFCAV